MKQPIQPVNWKKTNVEIIDKWKVKKTFILPDDEKQSFFVKQNRDVVQIIAVTQENKVIVIEQFRVGPEEVLLNLPGGGIEKGEDPIEAAKRELLEETGYSFEKAVVMGKTYRAPNQEGMCTFVIGFNAIKVKDPDEQEKQLGRLFEMSLAEFKTFLRQAKHTVFDLAGGGLALLYLEELGIRE